MADAERQSCKQETETQEMLQATIDLSVGSPFVKSEAGSARPTSSLASSSCGASSVSTLSLIDYTTPTKKKLKNRNPSPPCSATECAKTELGSDQSGNEGFGKESATPCTGSLRTEEQSDLGESEDSDQSMPINKMSVEEPLPAGLIFQSVKRMRKTINEYVSALSSVGGFTISRLQRLQLFSDESYLMKIES